MTNPTPQAPAAPAPPPPQQVQVPSFPQRRTASTEQEGGPFVKYVGEASHRRIRPHEWKQLFGGDESKMKNPGNTHEWSIKNKKMVPTSEFSDAQLDYLLCDDMQRRGGHSFLEVDYDDDGNVVQVKK